MLLSFVFLDMHVLYSILKCTSLVYVLYTILCTSHCMLLNQLALVCIQSIHTRYSSNPTLRLLRIHKDMFP